MPKVTANKPIIMGLSSGLANKNTIMVPNPALARNNPFKNGMVEHEQKGVIAPSNPAIK